MSHPNARLIQAIVAHHHSHPLTKPKTHHHNVYVGTNKESSIRVFPIHFHTHRVLPSNHVQVENHSAMFFPNAPKNHIFSTIFESFAKSLGSLY